MLEVAFLEPCRALSVLVKQRTIGVFALPNFDTIPFTDMFKIATSRERLKSAPYLNLKNSKRTSMCQENVIFEL